MAEQDPGSRAALILELTSIRAAAADIPLTAAAEALADQPFSTLVTNVERDGEQALAVMRDMEERVPTMDIGATVLTLNVRLQQLLHGTTNPDALEALRLMGSMGAHVDDANSRKNLAERDLDEAFDALNTAMLRVRDAQALAAVALEEAQGAVADRAALDARLEAYINQIP